MLLEARRIALFLDCDGVLADIAPRPELSRVEPALVADLVALRARLDGALAIVTGRGIASVDGLLAPFAPDIAGLHGAVWRIGGRMGAAPGAEAFHPVARWLEAELAAVPGVLVEDKGAAISLHWREAPHMEARLRDLAAQALRRLGPVARLQPGKAVIEIALAGVDKGAAIARFLASAPYAGRMPLFAGDDVADEAGFAVVEAAGGVSVHVGAGATAARRRVRRPADFRAFLAAFARADLAPGETPFAPV